MLAEASLAELNFTSQTIMKGRHSGGGRALDITVMCGQVGAGVVVDSSEERDVGVGMGSNLVYGDEGPGRGTSGHIVQSPIVHQSPSLLCAAGPRGAACSS